MLFMAGDILIKKYNVIKMIRKNMDTLMIQKSKHNKLTQRKIILIF